MLSFLPNPWVLLGGLVMLAVVGFSCEHEGYKRGANEQKVADQIQFDDINHKLAVQKAEAAAMLSQMQDEIVKKQVEHALVVQQLEKERADKQTIIDGLRSKYASSGLRFNATCEGGGTGGSGKGTSGPQTSTPVSTAPTIVQLPDKIAGSLRQLAYDADQLAANYATCYNYLNRQ